MTLFDIIFVILIVAVVGFFWYTYYKMYNDRTAWVLVGSPSYDVFINEYDLDSLDLIHDLTYFQIYNQVSGKSMRRVVKYRKVSKEELLELQEKKTIHVYGDKVK